MRAIRKADPTFTHYVPRTAVEAVDRYVRCRKNGLKPMLVPECLIACARGLPAAELDKFENWIISPNVDLENVDLVIPPRPIITDRKGVPRLSPVVSHRFSSEAAAPSGISLGARQSC